MICFIIALDSEAKPLFDNMTDLTCTTCCDKKIAKGKLCGVEVVCIVCGVGKVNAALATQIAVDKFAADKVVNIGVAGGLNDTLKIGDIYCISKAVQYDFDLVQLNGTAIGTLNEFEENYLPLKTVASFPKKKLATGDRFNDDKADYTLLTTTLKADIRDMEGGAVVQACAHAHVPCYSFKAISDLAGSGSTTNQFVANLALCAKSLKDNIKKIFEEING